MKKIKKLIMYKIKKLSEKVKDLINKLKDKLIVKLGGVPLAEYKWLEQLQGATRAALKSAQKEVREGGMQYVNAHAAIVFAWSDAVQEICRKSENTYYDWACACCAKTCDKRNGWCERFIPVYGKRTIDCLLQCGSEGNADE